MSATQRFHPEEQYDPDASLAGIHAAVARLPVLAAKGTGSLIRVSSASQATRSGGSLKFQREQERFLESHGAPTTNHRVFDARGESADAGVDRPVFRQLLEAVRRREIFVVLVSDADRIARNDPDSEALYDALQDIGGLVVINGEIHDPANTNHRFILRLRALIARYENEQRVFRSLTSKAARAREMSLPVRVATGLVWGSPDDPDFITRMQEAGMENLIAEEALQSHRTKVVREGRRYYVLPYPDAEIAAACRLTVRWLFEEGSITGLLQRISNDPEWPRPGQFPAVGSRRFNPEELHVDTTDEAAGRIRPMWKLLVDPEHGRAEFGRGVLYEWLKSPSVYGTYSARFPKLKKLSHLAASLGTEVIAESAFPSFASVEDQHRVVQILSEPDHPKIRGRWEGPRNYAIPLVYCSHPMPFGETCGRRLGAMYEVGRGGNYRYTSIICGVRGHRFSLPPQVDDEVLDMIQSAFTHDRLCTELDRIRCDGGAGALQLKHLEEEVATLRARAEWENRNAFDARRKGRATMAEFHEAQKERALEELEKRERDLERARARSDADGVITDREYQQIVALSSDLPELIHRARPLEGKLREIVRTLVRRVHARRLGTYAYHLEVELNSGQRLSRIVIARQLRAPQSVQALAHARLAPWLDPVSRSTAEGEEEARNAAEALAAELNDLLRGTSETEWTADRLFTAALLYREGADPGRSGRHQDVNDLAAHLQLAAERVLNAALQGRLGPAHMQGSTLALSPTVEELHSEFPEFASREVAEQANWPVQDVVTLKQLANETGWDRYRIERVAERGAGIRCDGAARQYTRRSAFQIPKEGDLARLLRKAMPKGADEATGRWITWTQAVDLLPGVNVRTFEAHTSVVRPGFGENGLASTYIWIDSQVEARVRKPTLPEAVAALGLPGLRVEDFHLRTDVLERLRGRFGIPSDTAWGAAVGAGHILEVRAQGVTSRRLRAYAWVPDSVTSATSVDAIERFLMGEFTPHHHAATSVDRAPSGEPDTEREAA